MKKVLLPTLILAVLMGLGFVAFGQNTDTMFEVGGQDCAGTQLEFADSIYCAEVVDTPAGRQQGLSDRERLDTDQAMLFVFDDTDTHGIWMKGMQFALDIVWLNESKEVVHIEERVAPDTYPHVFEPNSPAKYVIELNAGQVASAGVSLGDRIPF